MYLLLCCIDKMLFCLIKVYEHPQEGIHCDLESSNRTLKARARQKQKSVVQDVSHKTPPLSLSLPHTPFLPPSPFPFSLSPPLSHSLLHQHIVPQQY